jgi:hypothetical protein
MFSLWQTVLMQILLIKIPRRKRLCDACQQPFPPQSTYDTVVSELEEGWMRRDYCSACWQPALKEGAKSHWRATIPAKQDTPVNAEETLLDMIDHLRLLIEKGSNPPQAFILALYLSRKKVLQKRQELEHEGAIVTLYEIKGTEEMLAIPHVDITTLDGTRLQEELQAVLHNK